jgi:hypothetical protein
MDFERFWPRAARHWRRRAAASLLAFSLCAPTLQATQQSKPEYQLKTAFLYNFALFTEWPPETGRSLNLCIYGADPFGDEIDALQGKPVGEHLITVHRIAGGGSLAGCQIVFIASSEISELSIVLERLHGSTALTIADSPGAARRGVALNLSVEDDKVAFEANLSAARSARLHLSSKLLRLATQVLQ